MDKKIFTSLAILAVVMIGCAYAADSITISDVNFTIPDGFTEDTDEAIINESDSEDGQNYIVNAKTFEKDDQYIIIDVLEYEQNATDDMINDVGDNTTIKNVTGYYSDNYIVKIFSYIQDGKVVYITTCNDDDNKLLEEVLS